jgi:predicted DNA-binding transcriptional regulator YafY
MSPPTERVLALLELLQGSPGATAAELAGRLSVDERTVRRDATHLSSLGIQVFARRGRHGGFRLVPGHRLPPLMLSDPEAVAVVLGLATAASAGLLVDGESAADTALAKIRRMLPVRLAADAEHLLARCEPTCEPTCEPDGDLNGAADGDLNAEPEGAPVGDRAGAEPTTYEVEVTLETTLGVARARIPPTLAVLTEVPGGVLMRVRSLRLEDAARLLAGLGWAFVIHRPQELRQEVLRLAQRLSRAA